MAKKILIRPMMTEKTAALATNAKLNQYTFEIARKANKLEVVQAIKDRYGFEAVAVNTLVLPGKRRSRMVKGRATRGKTSPIKKAIVTLAEGDIIDEFYGAEDFGDEIVEVEEGTDEKAEA